MTFLHGLAKEWPKNMALIDLHGSVIVLVAIDEVRFVEHDEGGVALEDGPPIVIQAPGRIWMDNAQQPFQYLPLCELDR
jgi:hypothetical protein